MIRLILMLLLLFRVIEYYFLRMLFQIEHTNDFLLSEFGYIFLLQFFEWSFLSRVWLSLVLIINDFYLFNSLIDFCINLLFNLLVFFLEGCIVMGSVQWLRIIAFHKSPHVAFDLEPSYFVGVIDKSWSLAQFWVFIVVFTLLHFYFTLYLW